MRLYARADEIEVIGDEHGFVLVIDTDEGDRLRINIQRRAQAFAENVDSTIGAWLREGEAARLTRPIPGQITVDDLDAYPLGDPKRITLEKELL